MLVFKGKERKMRQRNYLLEIEGKLKRKFLLKIREERILRSLMLIEQQGIREGVERVSWLWQLVGYRDFGREVFGSDEV